MGSKKEGEFLKNRAIKFLANAKDLYGDEEYDLAAFNTEQSIQLFLKYALWVKLGDYDRVHQISKLLQDLSEVIEDKRVIEELRKENSRVIRELESAYIESRYLPSEYQQNQVEEMLEFADKIKKLVV